MTSENHEDEENLSAEVDDLLDQGLSQKEIQETGYSASLVRQRVRKRVKEGKAPPTSQGRGGTPAIRRQAEAVLPEWAVASVGELFDGAARDRQLFVAGMSVPLMGLRLFSEAVRPLIDLLTVWQRGQAEAARAAQGSGQELAHQAAQETLAGAMPQIMEVMRAQAAAQSPNPFATMMMSSLQPFLQTIVSQLMGAFMPRPQGQGYQPPGVQPGAQPQPGQPSGARRSPEGQPCFQQPASAARSGTCEINESEVAEAFGDDR